KEMLEKLAAPDVDDQRDVVHLAAGFGAQLRKLGDEGRRKVVHAKIAQVLKGPHGLAFARAGQAGDDDELDRLHRAPPSRPQFYAEEACRANAAASSTMRVASGWRCKMEAGTASVTGPWTARATAAALARPEAKSSTRRAAIMVWMPMVMAYSGTSAKSLKP